MEPIFSQWSGTANNSYFSVAAILARTSEYITSESSLLELEEELTKYYIPAFTITVTANSISIGVFPLSGNPVTVNLNRTEGASPEIVDGAPASSGTIESELYDKISPEGSILKVEIDPEMHTDSVIKRPIGSSSLGEDTLNNPWKTSHSYSPIETLLLTQIPSNTDGDTTALTASKANLQVMNNVVANQIKALDPESQASIISEYQNYQEVIISISQLLATLSEKQKEFTDLLDIQTLISNYLGFQLADDDTSEAEIQGGMNISALLEKIRLASIETGFPFPEEAGVEFAVPSWYDTEAANDDVDTYQELGDTGPNIKPSAFNEFVSILSDSIVSPSLIQTAEEELYRAFAKKYYLAGSFEANRGQLENLSFPNLNNSTIEEWYTEEMDAFLNGEKSPGLADEWVTQFQEVAKPIVDTINIDIAAGSGLLIRDSISKAIDNLVDSGLDISEYLGKDGNEETRFDEIGQHTSLGIKSTSIYPNLSQEKIAAEDYSKPSPLDDKRYLNFATLIRILHKLNPANKDLNVMPDEWFSEDEIIDWLYKDILNGGNLAEKSDSNVYSLADSVEMLGTAKNALKVNTAEYSMSGQSNLVGYDTTLSPGNFAGQSGHNLSVSSGLFDAKSFLGINWPKQLANQSKTSNSFGSNYKTTVDNENNIHGRTIVNGPLNFLYTTNETAQNDEGTSEKEQFKELFEFGTDSYFQINRFNSRKIAWKWKSEDSETAEYKHWKNWLAIIADKAGDSGFSNDLDTNISIASIATTGPFGGHIYIPNVDTGEITSLNKMNALGLQGISPNNQDFPVFLSWNWFSDNQELFADNNIGPAFWSASFRVAEFVEATTYRYWGSNQVHSANTGNLDNEDNHGYDSFRDDGYFMPFEWKTVVNNDGDNFNRHIEPLVRDNDKMKVDEGVWNSWFKSKGGGMLRYLGALEGIFKGLFKETFSILQSRLNKVTGSGVSVSLENMTEDFIKAWIKNLFIHVDFLYNNLDNLPEKWDIVVNHDGRIVLTDILQSGQDYIGWIDYDKKYKRRNNITKDHKTLAKAYVKFKSIISDNSIVSVSKTPYRLVNAYSLLPRQIRSDSTNSNYVNGLGLNAQYMSVPAEMQVRDSLAFFPDEIVGNISIDSFITTPVGIVTDTSNKVWMQNFGSFVQVRNLVDSITGPVSGLSYFLDSLEISEEQRRPYTEGLITVNDISKSLQILNSLSANVEKYSADENGISKFWKSMANDSLMNDILPAMATSVRTGGRYFVAFIGIKEKFILDTANTDTTYFIDLDYTTDGWYGVAQNSFGIHMPMKDGDGTVMERAALRIKDGKINFCNAGKGPIDLLADGSMQSYQNALISWAMNVKGYRLDASVFTENTEQLYSDFLINNESGVFPWKKDQFEKNIAVANVETIYNVSPWLFPQNYVMDVLKAKEFKYIIPVLVKTPLSSSNSLDGFQGNIKFKLGTARSPIWSTQ